MFLHLSIILFTGGGGSTQPPWIDPSLRWMQTTLPRMQTPSFPWMQTPPLGCRSPLDADPPYGQQAGGTLPTGMYTCSFLPTPQFIYNA